MVNRLTRRSSRSLVRVVLQHGVVSVTNSQVAELVDAKNNCSQLNYGSVESILGSTIQVRVLS